MTENGLLDKAGRLAAKEHLILKDKRIPDSMVVKITKPLSSEQGREVKHLHTSKTGPLTLRGTKEPKGMVNALMETRPSLKRVPLHRVSRSNPPRQALKKEKKKSPIASKPSTSGGIKKAVLSGATKGLMKNRLALITSL